MSTVDTYKQSRGDTFGLYTFMIAGVAIAAVTTWAAVARIIEVLPNRDVTVFADFSGTIASAPIGPNGAPVDVELDTALITAESLPGASVAALVIQQIVLALTVIVVAGCLVWLCRNIVRGQVFSRTNTVLVTTAGFTALAGFALTPFFGNMGANGAFARLSDRTFNNVILAVDPFQLIMVAFVVALASTVFVVGDRMRRDTEGLV